MNTNSYTGNRTLQRPGGAGSGDAPLYSGTWTVEERDYVSALIEEFRAGNIPGLQEKSTLRAFIAQQLGCSEKRVSKKYERSGYKGRMVYVPRPGSLTPEESKRRLDRLRELEHQFRSSRELLIALRPANYNQPKKGRHARSPSPPTGKTAQDQKMPAAANLAASQGHYQGLDCLEEHPQKKRAASTDLTSQASRQRTDLGMPGQPGRSSGNSPTIHDADYLALAQGAHAFQQDNPFASSFSQSRNLRSSPPSGLETNVGMTNSVLQQLLNRANLSAGQGNGGGHNQSASGLPLQDQGSMRREYSAPANLSSSTTSGSNQLLSLLGSNTSAISSLLDSTPRANSGGTNNGAGTNDLLSLIRSDNALSQSLFGASSVTPLSRDLDRFRMAQLLSSNQSRGDIMASLLSNAQQQQHPLPQSNSAVTLADILRDQPVRASDYLRSSFSSLRAPARREEEESKTNNMDDHSSLRRAARDPA